MNFAVMDIETTNLNADFGFVLCIVIKKYGDGQPQIFRIDDYPLWKKRKYDDGSLLKDFKEYLEENFDGIITYNGRRFDIPFLRSRFVYHRLGPLKKLFHVDIYYITRYRLKLHNAKLNSLIEFLNSKEEEIETKTMLNNEYYVRAVTGDTKGIDYIVEHCVKDVIALEQCYNYLKDQINTLTRQ